MSICAVVGFVSLNVVAWNHVHAMTHFVAVGERTAPPEALSPWEAAWVLAMGVTIPRPRNEAVPIGPFTTHRVPVDGQEVEIWMVPAADSIGEAVLFHGYAGAKDSLLPLVEGFHARRFSVVLVDFRGSGGSDGDDTTLGSREADDVAAVVEWLEARRSCPRLMYGFSMGGAAVLKAMSEADLAVDAMVVESVFDRLRTTVGHRFDRFGLPAFPGADLLLFWGSIDLGRNAFALAPVDVAAEVEVPTCVISGLDDPRVLPAEARAVAQALPRGALVLRRGGHELGGLADPEAWEAVLEAVATEVGHR